MDNNTIIAITPSNNEQYDPFTWEAWACNNGCDVYDEEGKLDHAQIRKVLREAERAARHPGWRK